MKTLNILLSLMMLGGLVFVISCNNNNNDPTPPNPTPTFAIGGTATDVKGSGLVLQNNGGDDLSVSQSGSFTFTTEVASGSRYSVTIKTQPVGQSCEVTNGSGTVEGADIENVAVACTDIPYEVGGTVTGLSGTGLVLVNNGGDDLSITEVGEFVFATKLFNDSTFNVTVKTQPAGQFCTITNGAGKIEADNVSNIVCNCEDIPPNTYMVGGNVTGITAPVALLLVYGDQQEELTVNAVGGFTFSSPVPNGTDYEVKIKTPPTGQKCTVTNAKGTIDGANVDNVTVACEDLPPDSFFVAGEVTGLQGTLILVNTANDEEIEITSNGPFFFPTPLANNSTYEIKVKSQPAGEFCTITNGSGTINGDNVTNVMVTCSAVPTYTIGGTVTGLSGTLKVTNNGVDTLTITENGAFTFTTPLANGSAYEVKILTQPSGEICSLKDGTGTVMGANVSNIAITCAAIPPTGTNYFATGAEDPAIFYQFLTDFSVDAKSTNGFGENGAVNGLAYDTDNKILYAYSAGSKKLLTVDRSTGVATEVGDIGSSELSDLAYNINGDSLYTINYTTGTLFSVDVSDGSTTPIYTDDNLKDVIGLAYDSKAQRLFGSDFSNNLKLIGRTDATKGVTTIGMSTETFEGLAYDTLTQILYGASGADPQTLYSISTFDASVTLRGQSGLIQAGGLTFSEDDNIIFAASKTSNGKLFRVDKNDAATSSVGSTGYSFIEALAWSTADNLIYGFIPGDKVLISLDETSGTSTFKVKSDLLNLSFVSGLTYDDETDDFYSVVQDMNDQKLATINRSNGSTSVSMTAFGVDIGGLAYDKANNILYGSSLDKIHVIDVSTGGVTSSVDVTGLPSQIKAITYDPNFELLVATLLADNSVYAIDPTTGDNAPITNPGKSLSGIVLKE